MWFCMSLFITNFEFYHRHLVFLNNYNIRSNDVLLKDCYDSFGGSYEAVRQRMPKDEIIKKFVLKFLDEPSYGNLSRALKNEDYGSAFLEAHSLKGVSANLGFERLGESSGVITELLRNKEESEIDREECMKAFEQVSKDYQEVIEAIKQLD